MPHAAAIEVAMKYIERALKPVQSAANDSNNNNSDVTKCDGILSQALTAILDAITEPAAAAAATSMSELKDTVRKLMLSVYADEPLYGGGGTIDYVLRPLAQIIAVNALPRRKLNVLCAHREAPLVQLLHESLTSNVLTTEVTCTDADIYDVDCNLQLDMKDTHCYDVVLFDRTLQMQTNIVATLRHSTQAIGDTGWIMVLATTKLHEYTLLPDILCQQVEMNLKPLHG